MHSIYKLKSYNSSKLKIYVIYTLQIYVNLYIVITVENISFVNKI